MHQRKFMLFKFTKFCEGKVPIFRKLRLFDNRMNLSNQTVVAIHDYSKYIITPTTG